MHYSSTWHIHLMLTVRGHEHLTLVGFALDHHLIFEQKKSWIPIRKSQLSWSPAARQAALLNLSCD